MDCKTALHLACQLAADLTLGLAGGFERGLTNNGASNLAMGFKISCLLGLAEEDLGLGVACDSAIGLVKGLADNLALGLLNGLELV